jgi:phosphoribosylanthranilate isomerase
MTRARVKICGITRLADAERALELGAHAVGFVLWPSSPRAVTPERAAAIGGALPALATRVGVFVNTGPAEVTRIAHAASLDAVQLHGDEDVRAYGAVGRRIIRAVCVRTGEEVAAAVALPADVTPLVDAVDPERRGGTGRTANWERAAALARRRPVILAGGLTPANVGDAVRLVRPWAVDVSSGVESTPGVKDSGKLAEFLANVLAISWEDE